MKKISVKDIKKGMSRSEMRSVKGAGCGEGTPCYCNGVFSGYPYTVQGCTYICSTR